MLIIIVILVLVILLVFVLLSAGADPNAPDKNGETPLHSAATNKCAAAAVKLLQTGADPNAPDKNGETPLHSAATNKRAAAAVKLLQTGADPNARDKDGRTPLHSAAMLEHLDFVIVLLRANADPNARDKDMRTPLHWAATNKRTAVAVELLRANANPNARDKDWRTPLHWAATNKRAAVAVELLRDGADPNARDKDGRTPLDVAEQLEYLDVADAMLKIQVSYGSVRKIPNYHLSPHLSTKKIETYAKENSIRAYIGQQFDGPIGQFGVAFWSEIKRLRPQAINSRSKLLRLVYEDRYLMTPLTFRLLWEVLQNAPGKGAWSKVKITSVSSETGEVSSRANMGFQDNWPNPQIRDQVMRELFGGARIKLLKTYECPHARTLHLEFEQKGKLDITLDQGFGAWRVTGRPIDFNGDAPAVCQAAMIKTTQVEIRRYNRFDSPMFLSW